MSADRVLAVFAHPDDESLLAGGTLAACARAGCEVGLLCLTHGEAGPVASQAPTDIAAARAAELDAAGRVLGVAWTRCLDFPDGSLEWADAGALRDAVALHVSEHAPAAVLTFSAEGLYWHPDHIATHRAVLAATATQPRVYGATWPLGLAARVVAELTARGLPADLWGLEPEAFGAPPESIDVELDVGRFLDAKRAALRAHRTQVGPGHLLHELPGDLAAELLGREHFVRLNAAADDWLTEVVRRA